MARKKAGRRRVPRSNPRGVIEVHTEGYGFVKTAEGEFFVPRSGMAGAFDGDMVEVAPLPARDTRGVPARFGKRPKARVVSVVIRAHDTIVGRYEVAEPFGVVVPEDPRIPYDIFTMRSDAPHVLNDSLVRVRIVTFPSKREAATGVVEEVLGAADADEVLVDLIVARHKLETAFSEQSLEQARASTLDVPGALCEGYRDLRSRFVFTIDPDDARDFDDALSLERAESGESSGAAWRLGVHIADVSHYVPWNSSLDLDARRRATSVYLADRVIPMLPEELSADLCSLRPGESRRSMTADLYLDEQGNLLGCEFFPAFIESKRRLTYDEAQDILEGRGRHVDGTNADQLAWRLRELSRLAKLRAQRRERRGGIDFSTVEAKAQLDAQGHAVGVDVRRKTDATKLVEEAMILANEAVAQRLSENSFPGLYRVHEQPAPDALVGLLPVLQEFPWFADVNKERFLTGDAHAVQQVLAASSGRAEGELVSSLVLRAMKRAVYRPSCDGHYGLASEAYTHFTSPIRRYPDLVVHRMLKAQLSGCRSDDFAHQVESLAWVAEHSSDAERVADAAARESQECKIIEYLQGSVGQAFSAIVSGVATYGLYVRLENTAEGLVPVRELGGEYFALDPVRYTLTGQDTGRVWRLGQRVAVVLRAADPRTRSLDFRLAGPGRGAGEKADAGGRAEE